MSWFVAFIVVINNLNPDFTNCNGQKKVIEIFGVYWHKDENPIDRINKYKEFGFDCLVLWENELNTDRFKEANIEATINKIIEFHLLGKSGGDLIG